MTQSSILFQQRKNNTPGWDISNRSTHEIKHWSMLIALPIVGMLLLLACFLLQGIFAVVGPWLIFLGVKLITRKVDQTTIR